MQLSAQQNLNFLLIENEKLLLKHISQGNFTDFWDFWQNHKQYLYHCCKNWLGGNSTEAEEVLSEVMIKAWEKLPYYADKITNLKAWLTRLAHNLCVDIQRKRKRSATLSENLDEIIFNSAEIFNQEPDSPESALLNRELLNYLNTAIAELPAKLRDVLKLRYYDNLSYKEIAQKLNISPDNVGKKLQKAREILEKRVKKYLSGLDTVVIDEVAPKSLAKEITQSPVITIDYQTTAICLSTQLPVWFH